MAIILRWDPYTFQGAFLDTGIAKLFKVHYLYGLCYLWVGGGGGTPQICQELLKITLKTCAKARLITLGHVSLWRGTFGTPCVIFQV